MLKFEIRKEELNKALKKFKAIWGMEGGEKPDILIRAWQSGKVKVAVNTKSHYLELLLKTGEVSGEGAALVPLESFEGVEGEGGISIAEGVDGVTITCEGRSISAEQRAVESFPVMAVAPLLDASFMVEEGWLAQALEGVFQPILSGRIGDKGVSAVKFDIGEKRLEAYNQYMAAIIAIPRYERSAECNAGVLLSAREVEFLLSLLSSNSECNLFLIHDRELDIVASLGFTYGVRGQDVRVPALQWACDSEWKYSLRVNSNELHEAALQTAEEDEAATLLFVDSGNICLYSSGGALRSVPAKRVMMAKDECIGINPAYLAAACAIAGGEEVVLHGAGCEEPVLVEGGNCVCLVMPIRIASKHVMYGDAKRARAGKL